MWDQSINLHRLTPEKRVNPGSMSLLRLPQKHPKAGKCGFDVADKPIFMKSRKPFAMAIALGVISQ